MHEDERRVWGACNANTCLGKGAGHVLGEIRIKRMCTSVHSGSAYGASAADGMWDWWCMFVYTI
eukprot:scaffold63816_cov63-Phaeocystis_antarctica.AAC.8